MKKIPQSTSRVFPAFFNLLLRRGMSTSWQPPVVLEWLGDSAATGLGDDEAATDEPALGAEPLPAEEFSSRLVAADEQPTAALPDGSGLVVLDGAVTPELEADGWAKDPIGLGRTAI